MRLALAGALVATLLVAAGAGAVGNPAVPGSGFVSDDGESFGLVSNSQWLANGKHAYVAQVIRPANPRSGNPEEYEPLATIWAPKCEQGRQVVRFTREVFVAGPLWKLGLYVGGAQPHPGFFERFEVLINGVLVFRTNGGGGGFERTAGKGGLIRWGVNDFEVIAVKKAFDHGYGCRKGGSGHTGISFVLRGDFGTDTFLPVPAKEQYEKSVSRAYKVDFSVAVRNKGPGGLAAGRLFITFDAPQGELSGVSKLTLPQQHLPLVGCTEMQDGREYRRSIFCRLANLRSGTTVTPAFSFYGNTPDGSRDVRITIASQVGGGYEQGNTRDNSKIDVIVFCAAGSADPKCPK
jgi:hypothetical protein